MGGGKRSIKKKKRQSLRKVLHKKKSLKKGCRGRIWTREAEGEDAGQQKLSYQDYCLGEQGDQFFN